MGASEASASTRNAGTGVVGRESDLVEFEGIPHAGTPLYPGGQRAWLDACLSHPIVVIAVGRRVGKTTFVRFLWRQEAAMHKGFYVAAYMAQNHARAWGLYDLLLQSWGQVPGLIKRHRDQGQDRWIETAPLDIVGMP